MKYPTAFLVLMLVVAATGQSLPETAPITNASLISTTLTMEETAWIKQDNTNAPEDRETKTTRYRLNIKNTGTTELHNVQVDYCIYRDRKIQGVEFIETDSFSRKTGTIASGSDFSVTPGGASYKSPSTRFLNDVVGAHFRIYTTTPEGKTLLGETRYPASLSTEKYPWKDYEDPRSTVRNSPEKAEAFLNPELLVITANKNETDWVDSVNPIEQKRKTTFHLLTLHNKSAVKFSSLRIDFCEYRNGAYGNDGATRFHSKNVGTINPSVTENVALNTTASFRFRSGGEDALLGLCARIYLPLSDGQEVMREIRIPESLSEQNYPWKAVGKKQTASQNQSETKKEISTETKKPAIPVTSEPKYRTFKKADGTALQARLLSLGASSGIVKLEMSDGSEVVMKLPAFAEADQAYIKDWYSAFSLLSNGKLLVTTKKNKKDGQLFHGYLTTWDSMFPNMGYKDQWHSHYPGTTYDEISYGVDVENTSGQPLTDIRIEYCIYHQTRINETLEKTVFQEAAGGMSGWWPAGSVQKYPEQTVSSTIQGTLSFKNIPNDQQLAQITDSLKLVRRAEESKSKSDSTATRYKTGDHGTRNTRTIEGTLLGIRYRVYAPTPAGNYAMMEFSDPESLIERTEWPNQ